MTDSSPSLKVFLVDDEYLARERLKRLLSETPFTFCGEAENGEDAIKHIRNNTPDIVLLDIRMPGIDGLKVAEEVCQLDPAPAIIFCTAYNEYAIEAFKYQASAYLLKPVRREQFVEVLQNATKLSLAQIRQIADSQAHDSKMFTARTWQGLERIMLDDIFFFQADHKCVTIHHKSGESVTDHSLKDIESELGNQAFRSHRNSIVMTRKIKSLSKKSDAHHFFLMQDGSEVPISRRLMSQAKALLLNT